MAVDDVAPDGRAEVDIDVPIREGRAFIVFVLAAPSSAVVSKMIIVLVVVVGIFPIDVVPIFTASHASPSTNTHLPKVFVLIVVVVVMVFVMVVFVRRLVAPPPSLPVDAR
jgi:hypothetical protein